MTTATSDEHQQRAQITETVFQEVRRVVPEGLSQEPDLVTSLSEIGLDAPGIIKFIEQEIDIQKTDLATGVFSRGIFAKFNNSNRTRKHHTGSGKE
ncbi:MAG: hypothetical protein GY869_18220 [Planctomycetes bacterium]|nr:hypothetical protein [Planctomycetota bacterium]